MATATSIAGSAIARMLVRNLNCSPLGIFIACLSASFAISVDFDVRYSLDRPKRLPVGWVTTAVPSQRLDRQNDHA
ncbi:hypothetical protein ACFFWD_30565 [Bradyrhizobium erythrophlei]|uniref:hypothetical protein n=1 Tax=Bradyrhizobium erythrophlei TaxID=1437360 RepID=UPI0035EAA30A